MDAKITQRRFDLDWLRVIAILTVFVYHTTRFFNSESWHVKNSISYIAMDIFETTLANWNMAVIFTISGASLFYAIGKGSTGRFVKEKVLRLIVPLATMGMIVFGSWQIYLDRRWHGEFNGSFFEFIPIYFQPENFAWKGVHLWYLEMLFVFCLVFLPFFLWLKRGAGRRTLGKLGNLLARSGALYLVVLPTILSLALTGSDSFLGNTEWGGGSILSHATFFLAGFLIISHDGMQKTIQRLRWLSLVLAVILMAALFSLMTAFGDSVSGALLALGRALWGFWSWNWTLAILGFGMKNLNFNKPILSYANEAVLPFYILHQPVLLTVGYFVVQWSIPAALKFLVIDALSFIVIMALYESGVRRWNVIRFLFGMKMSKQASIANSTETQISKVV